MSFYKLARWLFEQTEAPNYKHTNSLFYSQVQSTTLPYLLIDLREGRDGEEDGAEIKENDCLIARDGQRRLAEKNNEKDFQGYGSSSVVCLRAQGF